MAGLDAFGSQFIRLASATATSGTAVAEVVGINGPNIEGEDIDVTNHDSPNGFMQFLPGIVDPGEVELDMNYTKAEANTLYGLVRTTGYYRVQYPDASKWTFEGYLKGVENEAPHDDKVSGTATFKVSGKPTFSTN